MRKISAITVDKDLESIWDVLICFQESSIFIFPSINYVKHLYNLSSFTVSIFCGINSRFLFIVLCLFKNWILHFFAPIQTMTKFCTIYLDMQFLHFGAIAFDFNLLYCCLFSNWILHFHSSTNHDKNLHNLSSFAISTFWGINFRF